MPASNSNKYAAIRSGIDSAPNGSNQTRSKPSSNKELKSSPICWQVIVTSMQPFAPALIQLQMEAIKQEVNQAVK